MKARPPGRSLLLLLVVRSVRAPSTCPADAVGPTSYSLDGEPVECARLANYCGYQHDLQCDVATACPVTCGACSSAQFCNVATTGFAIGGQPASCTQLAPYCRHATYGPIIRFRCPEACGCSFCPGPSPPAPPLAPSCDATLELVLVIDCSGSMRAWMDQVRQFSYEVALSFAYTGATSSSTGTQVAVVRFANAASVLTDLTSSAATATSAISALEDDLGNTNISDGLRVAHELLTTGPNVRANVATRVVMVLTDGKQSKEYGGDAHAIAMSAALKASGINVFAVGFGQAVEATIQALASEPHALYAYTAAGISSVREHFAGRFCTLARTRGYKIGRAHV